MPEMIFELKGIKVYTTETGPYIPGRAVAERKAVSRLINERISPAAILEHHESGAPYLSGIDKAPKISITHGAGMAAIALSTGNRSFGIDIEEPREQLRRVSGKFLTEAELSDAGNATDRLLEYWTAKEAIYKGALTPGLALQDICVDRRNSSATCRGINWSLHWFNLGNALMCLAVTQG